MPTPALYGYGLESKRFPAAPQRAALLAFGVEKRRIIIEDRQVDVEFESMVATGLRKGHDDIVAVQYFHLLAPGAAELQRRIRAIHAIGAVIVETAKGRRSDNRAALADMIFEAHETYTGRLLTPKIASRMGKRGAKNSPRTQAIDTRMPTDEARAIWRAKHHHNWQEALAAINADTNYHGYSKSAAYTYLGPRDVKPGRKPK
jgi:hypothetical protein